MSDIDLAAADHLLTTTKQVRQRLDLTRPVPRELLLECIDIASHAPMGGNLERNRWLVVDDPELKAAIAQPYQAVGRPYLAANETDHVDERKWDVEKQIEAEERKGLQSLLADWKERDE